METTILNEIEENDDHSLCESSSEPDTNVKLNNSDKKILLQEKNKIKKKKQKVSL